MPKTAHQEEKFNEIIDLIENKGVKRAKLIGNAGTGKTWLTAELVKYFKRSRICNTNYNNGHIFVTAPTNKALGVLQSKIDTDVDFKTIHSACRLYMYVPHSGPPTFQRQKFYGKKKGDEFEDCKLAIVDEASMLNSDFLGKTITHPNSTQEYIKGYLEDFKFPIIFVGDDKQLNPVGEPISPVWLKDWPTVQLTEIVRQGAGNPIIDLSRDLDLISFKTPKVINGTGYIYSDAMHTLIEDLAEVNGTDELKYLAYTNRLAGGVEGVNNAVRIRRYGDNVKKIEKEETIVFNSPHGNNYTSKEVKVEDVDIVTDYIHIPTEKTKYDHQTYAPMSDMQKIKMKYYRINNSFNVVHEQSHEMYNSIFTTLKENNKRYGWSGRGYFYFESLFADITYNHALTVHKSQGSTYKETIINIGNICFNRNMEERQRMLYTAVTRASNLIILNNVV